MVRPGGWLDRHRLMSLTLKTAAATAQSQCDLAAAALGDTQAVRRCVGQINDTARMKRPAIIDAYDHAAPAARVADACVAGQRRGRMRSGHRKHVVDLADGGLLPVKLAAVPRRNARCRSGVSAVSGV